MCSVHSTNEITVYKWVPRNTLIFPKYLWPLLLLPVLNTLTAWAGPKLVGTVETSALEIHISQASP